MRRRRLFFIFASSKINCFVSAFTLFVLAIFLFWIFMSFTIVASSLSFFGLFFAARLLLRFALLLALAVASFSFVSS